MKKDEFNHVKIVNEKADSYEFGSSQNFEYTFYDENKNSINDEINNYNLSNDEKYHKKEEDISNKNYSNDKLKKIKNNKNNFQSFTTAIASMVSVTTLAILIGISVISAKCNFKVLDIVYNSITYSLELENTNDDKYILSLENKDLNYYEYYELNEGNNDGEFLDLTPETKYLISVINTSFNNYSIYSSEITTPAFEITFDILTEANVEMEEMRVYSSFGDNDVSNIELHITSSDGLQKHLKIEPVEGIQKVKLNSEEDEVIFDMLDSKGFTYYFTYELNGSISSSRTKEKKVVLTNSSDGPIDFVLYKDVTLDDEGTALLGSAYLSVKEDGKLSSLTLHLISVETGEEKTYELNTIFADQKFELIGINDEFAGAFFAETGFNYYLTYVYDGKEETTEEDLIIFYPAFEERESEFVAPTITWDKKADFANLSIDVTLSYDNTSRIDVVYFELTDSNSNRRLYDVFITTDTQTINLSSSDSKFDITNGEEYHYVFYYEGFADGYYSEREIIEEGDIVFEDYLGRETKYNGVALEYIVASENLIALRMPNFVDTLGTYDSIKCYINGPSSSGAPYVELALNDKVQEFDITDKGIDLTYEYGYLYMEAKYSNGNVSSLIYDDQDGIEVNFPAAEKHGITTFELLGSNNNYPTYFAMNNKYYLIMNIETRDYDNYYDNYYLRFTQDGSNESFDVLIDKNSAYKDYIELKDVVDDSEFSIIYFVQGIGIKNNVETQIMATKEVTIYETMPADSMVYGMRLVNGNVISRKDGKLEMYIYLTDNTGELVRNLKFNLGDIDDGINNPTYTFDVDIVGKDLSTEAYVLDLKSLDNYDEIIEFINGKDLYCTFTYTIITDDVTITKNAFYGRITIID